MVTKQYIRSYSQSCSLITQTRSSKDIKYSSNGLGAQIFETGMEDLLREAITHPFKAQRIHAINQIGEYGRGDFEVGILRRLSRHDPDLQLRVAAGKALDKIRERLNN